MSDTFNNLINATETLDEEEIINNLKIILTQGTNIEISSTDVIKTLLQINRNEILKLSTEIIAEWAKTAYNRKNLTNESIINCLMSLLDNNDVDIVFNSIRALGNICYENEEACNLVDKIGINNILMILKNDDKRNDQSLTTKVSGLLLNLISLHDGLSRTVLKNEIVPVLEKLMIKYFETFEDNQMLLTFLLTILSNLLDYFDEQNVIFSEKLCQLVVDIFKKSTNPEISVICLEIFHGQSEKDEIKALLAKEGVCELLFELIKKYKHQVNDEESRSVLKMACDLIVIILTGDDCMYMLYNNGEGQVYCNMITWLDSDDSDLLSTGILAIGNFARRDIHCIQMVKNGISKKLISLLSQYNSSTGTSDIKIQHALLSTLKNLVIPHQNKEQILQEGLIDVIYPMIKIDQYLVVFKLLGTFRMVIDGQESAALDLISRVDFLERLVYWCYNSDHLGVRGEVPRLLAWLIKNCHSFKPFEKFVFVKDTVRCVVEMIASNHSVMQNEAFYAIKLLFIGCCSSTNNVESSDTLIEKLIEEVINADIGKHLNFVINKYGEKMDQHSVDNLVALLEQILSFKSATKHLKSANISKVIEKMSLNPNIQNASDKFHKITTVLNE
ncbi:rap1 GTPase-GDP dissociation stimulator 1 [Anoplophora glabripennis]|uniref:rap1 GTPase-GDP dissociation stimulator 1 n=1 Tax=Anoplophora glabripennis TaxID=217634 RepID=UPI000873AE30|nr:rap1 GTPase-GDP dissociation stimulator 1 [Anoplophora glabripennis]